MENEQIDIFNTNDTNTIKKSKDEVQKIIKPYKKYINFYKIIMEPSLKPLNVQDSQLLKETCENPFSKQNTISSDGINIDCLEKGDSYFFGCLHKSSPIDILTEIKSTIDGEDLNLDELIFEHITYFYIDYKNMCMSVIKTQRIQNSALLIAKVIFDKSGYNFNIYPFKKEQNEIEQMLATGYKLTFVDVDKDFVILDELKDDDCELSQFHIEVNFKKNSKKFVPNIIKKYKSNEKVKKLSISTDNEDIDILKNTFTKQVAINLSKDYKQDLDSIKISLRDELLKIINN